MAKIDQETKSEPEQLSFAAFDLAAQVAGLIRLKAEKKDFNDDMNVKIKLLEKSIYKLSAEVEAGRARVS